MLDTLPYADLLAIHNALAEKPARRFDTRANGEKRTLALMEARGLTLEEAARLANVVLGEPGIAHDDPPEEFTEQAARVEASATVVADAEAEPLAQAEPQRTTITVSAEVAPLVTAFVAELEKPDRPTYLASMLRRLTGEKARSSASRQRAMTASQRTIVDLCLRPEGATGKELAEGCGWPSIAARATCRKLADRFGYELEESPKADGRGISFRMIAPHAAGA